MYSPCLARLGNVFIYIVLLSGLVLPATGLMAAQCPCCVPDEGAELHVGEHVELGNTTLLDGTDFDFTSISGERIAVLFWATWCPTCMKELSDPAQLHRLFSVRNTVLFGVNMDYDPESARRFIAEKTVTFPNTSMSFELVDQFKSVVVLPKLVILDTAGKVLSVTNPTSHQQIETALSAVE